MKRIILIGNVACGKTTLSQKLNHLKLDYKKTQAIEVCQQTIDTPGEYLENRSLLKSLMVTSVEAQLAVFVQDASQDRFCFSPGMASAFPLPVAGVVTKIDLADEKQVCSARELLILAGADPVFCVSPVSGEGMEALENYLKE